MAQKTVPVKIEYQVQIPGFQGQASKTFEYSTEGPMKVSRAYEADPFEHEIYVLNFIAKEFKAYAKAQSKKLAKKQKAAKKGAT